MSPSHQESFQEQDLSEKVDHRKMTLRGLLTNLSGMGLLYLIGFGLQLEELALVSFGVNFLVFLLHALPFDSEMYFDITGTLTYVTLVAWTCVEYELISATGTNKIRAIVLVVMSMLWALRLGSFLLARICKAGKDSRFADLRKNKLVWMGVWTVQAAWCFVVISPVLVVVSTDGGGGCHIPNAVDFCSWALWVFAFLFEVVADRQKSAFRQIPENSGKFINTGLWAFSRHPNYFGEILMWVAICINVSFSGCLEARHFLIWFSPLTTILLLKLVSGVPMLEKQGQERWGNDPAYQHYIRNTPEIVPACSRPAPYTPGASEIALS